MEKARRVRSFRRGFDSSAAPRAAALACAELRIEPGTEPKPLASHSRWNFRRARAALRRRARFRLPASVAGSESAARRAPRHQLARRVDPGRRAGRARADAGGRAVPSRAIEDRRYERSLQAEIAKVEPQANRAAALDRETRCRAQRTSCWTISAGASKSDMDVLEEMTRILPPPTWLNLLDLNRTQV